jgi:3-methyladenine DNA glycosylase AlkD
MSNREIDQIVETVWQYGDEERIPLLDRVLQTQVGGYGYGDLICGARVPILRKIAAKYKDISLEDAENLLQDELHEARFVALVILIKKFKKQPREVLEVYLNNTKHINNWDLVDISAAHIVGNFCLKTNDVNPIWELANSTDLWKNRMALVASWTFVKAGNCELTLELCRHFLGHKHHLIHRAMGWMFREIGKKDKLVLMMFLDKYKDHLPRITLSYAKERLRSP